MRILKGFVLASLVFFAFYILFHNLGKPALDNWDEAWYGEVTKQILRTKDFIDLRWNGEYFFDKPPLYIWLSVLVSLIFGFSEFSLRFVSALSGLIIIVLVLLYSYRKWGLVSSLIAFATLAFNNIFIWRSRSGNVDLLGSLFVLVSYFLRLSKIKNRHILLGLVFAFIYLTRESLVIFPFTIFVLHEFLFERKKLKNDIKDYGKLILIFLGIPSLWLIFGYSRLGNSFIESVLNPNQRAGDISFSSFHLDYFWYTYYSLQRRYFYVFIIGLLLLIKKIKKRMHFLLLAYSILILIPLSFAQRNNNWYLIPSMPFWSLTIAYATYRFLKFHPVSKYLVIFPLALAFVISYKTYTINILPILNTFSSSNQKESGQIIKKLSKKNDIVIRLDHLYPATIFYSDRKVFSSPTQSNTKKFFLSRSDLIDGIKKEKYRWLVGESKEVDKFVNTYQDIDMKRIQVNQSETIIKIN